MLTLYKVRESRKAREIAKAVLLRRVQGNIEVRGRLAAMPIYLASNENTAEKVLTSASRVGWRYMFRPDNNKSGCPAAIDFIRTAGGRPRLHSFHEGDLASDIENRIENWSKTNRRHSIAYMPRLLKIPEIFFEAIWLKAVNNRDSDIIEPLTYSKTEKILDGILEELASAKTSLS